MYCHCRRLPIVYEARRTFPFNRLKTSVVKEETTITEELTELWSSRQQPLSQGNCLKSVNHYLAESTPLGLATRPRSTNYLACSWNEASLENLQMVCSS